MNNQVKMTKTEKYSSKIKKIAILNVKIEKGIKENVTQFLTIFINTTNSFRIHPYTITFALVYA